ncbi:hypothetical protein EST38_g529 [Candolleomyces aberdarensis]|uniref:Uncharacterized protein n=1 Tax=Candolleomyces aberdarensis TaxID=2316362 RepID=A0A4Q2E0Z8_9AGAR|nr:hypothetical protein EST38_g529 [Candolleomyces aberdarensis]
MFLELAFSKGETIRFYELPEPSVPYLLEENDVMVALQESGHLSIYSLKDGGCFSTAFAPSYSSAPPSRDVWTWSSLRSAVVDETSVLLVTAATDSNTSAATPDKEENSTEKSQTIALKLSTGPNAISMDKLAAWVLEGPAHGIGIFKESDNSSTLFSISPEGHFLVRRIGVQEPPVETAPSSASVSDTDSTLHLALPKSLKAIVSRSSETLPLVQPTTPTIQATVHETLDVGNLISDSTVSGLSTRNVDEKLLGIVWAHRELIIFEYHAYSLRKLLKIDVSYLEDVEWLDNETYALSFPDRIEIYKLQFVNADNDRIDQELGPHPDSRYRTLELCAGWIIFSTPLVKVVEFQDDTGPLRGCILCIAQDGTIAVIAVDGFQFLYMIPGAPSPLTRISLGESNLVLTYGESIARLWDVQTKEFWRSMSIDKAEEMFSQGGWKALDLVGADIPLSQWSTVAPAFSGTDAAATLDLSLDKVVTDCISITKTISTSRDEVRNILQALERLRLLLSIVITPGLNGDVDSICTGKLKLRPSTVGVGFTSHDTTTIYPVNGPHHIWSISGNVSAARMLAIVFILRAMALFEELSEAANTVIAFYTLSLSSCVGSQYAPPSLEWLGQRWFSAPPDLRASMRVVFEATLAQVADQDAMKLAEKWQQHRCALTDITKSLTLYLHDEDSNHRVLAIDICSKGFHVWQRYIDAMEILRALFSLATGVRKDSISVQNVAAQARTAVLTLATNHTALFMSTLCLDVLNPPSLEHRRSVMQIIAFLIRKRRHILQPNLPRLMEAVVKSLDPNSNANREAVLDTATEIMGFVVKHFPTVDFHMNTQRLAVGTSEGAVVMYDVKTAIRLYVLEGHKRQLAACSFSPDGRRLVTLSLAEQTLLIWKVGTSFSSFFNPGAPPRQGHSGSEPFKTLEFHIGSEAEMTAEETLDLVKFDWVADRSVKVKIRDTILTFST